MACGSGKTRVAGAVAQLTGAQLVVFFAPSLALIRQTLREWRAFGYLHERQLLCICSDDTVTDIDPLQVLRSDVGIATTTESAHINAFLTKHSGPTTLFCTYHSAQALAKGMPEGRVVDLALFDEAHKTAGTFGGRYTSALDDAVLPINTRLFLTATPRHSNARRRTPDGELAQIYSMDDLEVYGPVAFNLPFKQAIESGIICDYRLIVSTVTDAEITEQFRTETVIRTAVADTQVSMVAQQISMAKALIAHKLRRAISFHSTVEESKVFAQDEFDILGRHGIRVFHINGSMPMRHREELISQFDSYKGAAVLSNARCLGEGIDLPAVDLVGFMSPKDSQIDIAQIIGRCLRNSPGKEFGHILLPLYISNATTELELQACVRRERYQTIWEVIATLQEQDFVLGTTMSQMRTQAGLTPGYTPPKLEAIRVIAAPALVEAIELAISSVAIEKLTTPWDENFGQLQRYMQDQGREPPQGFIASNGINLGIWCNAQRQLYKQGFLPADRETRLQAIGFAWEANAEKWEIGFDRLMQYIAQNHDANVPVDASFNGYDLGRWLARQRRLWRDKRLSQDRLEKLLSVGVVLDTEAGFERFVRNLQIMKEEIGNIQFARQSSWQAMPAWYHKVRSLRKAGRLESSRIERLDALGFPWELRDSLQERLSQLAEFKSQAGHANPGPEHANGAWRSLYLWISTKRRERELGTLDAAVFQALDAMAVDWNPAETAWQAMFAKVRAYLDCTGSLPTRSTVVEGCKIGAWLYWEREKALDGKLATHRQTALASIGANEDFRIDAKWQVMFESLKEFAKRHGHADIRPGMNDSTPQLMQWVYTQRRAKSQGAMDPKREAMLDEVGLIWNPLEVRKQQQKQAKQAKAQADPHAKAQRLIAAKEAKEAAWRSKMKAWIEVISVDKTSVAGKHAWKRLTVERKAALEADPEGWKAQWFASCGIAFSTRAKSEKPRANTQTKIDQMIGAISRHGSHSEALEKEPKLSQQASILRLIFKKNGMTSVQAKALDDAGFIWVPLEEKWEAMFEQARLVFLRTSRLLKTDMPMDLYQWLVRQRKEHSDGILASDRVERLNTIGMTWTRRVDFYEANLERLTKLYQQDPTGWMVGINGRDPVAAQMVAHFRKLRRAGKLTQQQIDALDKISFVWEAKQHR
jgi:superfamily II DNA or RNA helicase